jgi:pimeloyl-ACP methyl ester carboxylesterase
MGQRSFRMIETNGITLRVMVEGQGPLLLLLHGFPQCWYLWRDQIDELVAAGYQVAVPDQRGYGGSDKPADIDAYDAGELVADAVGIADALGRETFTLVTHDFGAVLGWDIALLHPERVTAVFALSVPPVRMHVSAADLAESLGDNFFYVVYFQQPGVAEAELDADVRRSLRMQHYAVSGDAPAGLYLQPKPASSKLLDGLIDPDPLPSWLTEEDLDVYYEAYRDGFRGPINWYRSYRDSELTRAPEHAKITQPCHLMVGSKDPAFVMMAEAFANVNQNVTDLRGNIVLDGAGHWLPLERTKEVNSALLAFLRGLDT